MNREIFRAYDIPGLYGIDFQPYDFYRIACAFGLAFNRKPSPWGTISTKVHHSSGIRLPKGSLTQELISSISIGFRQISSISL